MKTLPFLSLLFLCLVLTSSCQKHTPTVDARQEFLDATKDSSATNFNYATSADGDQMTSTFTNPAVNGLIHPQDGSMTLRYTRVSDGKDATPTLYKTELVTKGNMASLVVTDVTNGKEYWRKDLSDNVGDLDTIVAPPASGFNSIEDCIKDFNCKHKGELQCRANETCENQYAGIICCLTNGQCFSIHFVVTPTSWRCRLRDIIPDLDGIVLARR